VHRIALKEFATKLVSLVNKEDRNDDNGSNTAPSAGGRAQESSRDGSSSKKYTAMSQGERPLITPAK
jgi:hypothetical protein